MFPAMVEDDFMILGGKVGKPSPTNVEQDVTHIPSISPSLVSDFAAVPCGLGGKEYPIIDGHLSGESGTGHHGERVRLI